MRVDAFTSSGTWTVPAGVTYAVAHIRAGGGSTGTGSGATGGASSVAFASGTVTANGGTGVTWPAGPSESFGQCAGQANSGNGGQTSGVHGGVSDRSTYRAMDGAYIVSGAAVTPAASVTVTVGAGATAGTNGAAGGSGYVWIEYFV